MAVTPLYKSLKTNGTTIYTFPGVADDISASYQNQNFKMYFSKYVLLNLPKQQLVNLGGTQATPVYWNFDPSTGPFKESVNYTPPPTYADQIVESLRNYVANEEVVIRNSILNNTQFFYDNTTLQTVSERVFFKWCKALNVIDFEPAFPDDQYFSNLSEFTSNSINDDTYFPEYLWQERQVIPWNTLLFYQSAQPTFTLNLEVEFGGTTNFRVGDIVKISNVSNTSISIDIPGIQNSIQTAVLYIIPAGATQGQRIIFDTLSTLLPQMETTGTAQLVYNKLVQYIGEVNGVSNVQQANSSYTEVYAHIPDQTGMTPDILFRTITDDNYLPNMTYPIVPSQYQPEIVGAELFNSPIVSTPQNYPGGYFGQFDTLDFTYTTSTGDSLRRSGDYYGVNGDKNTPVINGSTIDGVTIDFNTSHYVKMNVVNHVLTNFDQFDALEVNNKPPVDFEFNAILWYYTIVDLNGVTKTNLYGISFLDNPDNNQKLGETGLRFPTYKKLVSNGFQDGTSYAFNLTLNFNINTDNPVDAYNPQVVNSIFSMNLFNDAMSRLASTNDSFMNIISNNINLTTEIGNIKQLIYTQTDIDTINSRITFLESLLQLFSANQMLSSDTISVNVDNSTSPPAIYLNNIDTSYKDINQVFVTDMYSTKGVIPVDINVTLNKNFMIVVNNNDTVKLTLPNNDRLILLLSRDLDWKQSVDIILSSESIASENKKLDIYLMSVPGVTASIVNQQLVVPATSSVVNSVETLLIGDIDLPVLYNSVTQLPNSASTWKDFKFEIDFTQAITLTSGGILKVPISGNTSIISNSIKSGDSLVLNNFFVGTSSVFDFSGQYVVSSLGVVGSSYIMLDVNINVDLIAYGASASLPLVIHGTSSTLLSNLPYFSLNKGKRIRVTRIDQLNSPLDQRYHIDVDNINYIF